MEGNNEILWEKLRGGSQKAIEDLYRLNYQILFSYAFKISGDKELSKDCIQEIFLRLWEKKNQLNEVSRVRSYLLQSVWHSIIKKLKKNNHFIPYDENDTYDMEVVFSYETPILHDQPARDQEILLNSAFNRLTRREREIIFMVYYEGLTIEEIQQITGLKYQSIKNLIYRAMFSLRANLHKKK